MDDVTQKVERITTRLEELTKLIGKAIADAQEACRIAQEELRRPLTQDEKKEQEEGL